MNLVEFLQTLVEKWATDTQCGFCWNFEYGRSDYTNLIKLDEANKCCIHFLLEKESTEKKYKYNADMGTSHLSQRVFEFEAFVGAQSDFTIQYHKELGYPQGEGKYETNIKPILDCLNDNLVVDLCALITSDNTTAHFESIKMIPKINYKDNNFDGVFIRGKLIEDLM